MVSLKFSVNQTRLAVLIFFQLSEMFASLRVENWITDNSSRGNKPSEENPSNGKKFFFNKKNKKKNVMSEGFLIATKYIAVYVCGVI